MAYGNSLRTLFSRFKRRRGSLDGRVPGLEYSRYRQPYSQFGSVPQSSPIERGGYDPRIEYQAEDSPDYRARAEHPVEHRVGITPPRKFDPLPPLTSPHPPVEIERATDDLSLGPEDDPRLDIQPMIDAARFSEDHALHQQNFAEMTQPLFERLMANAGGEAELAHLEIERAVDAISEDPSGEPPLDIQLMIDASAASHDSDPFAEAEAQFDHAMVQNAAGETAEFGEMATHDPFASPLEQMVEQATPEPDPWDMQDPYQMQRVQMLYDLQLMQMLHPFQMPGPMM